MAIDTWINVTVDSNNRSHVTFRKGSAGSDATFSYDKAKITSLSIFDAVAAAVRLNLQSAGIT